MTDREELEQVAQDAADRAVQGHGEKIREHVEEGITTALTRCGLDVEHPMESQNDMQFLRRTRESAEGVRSKVVLGAAGVLIAGAGAWILSKLA